MHNKYKAMYINKVQWQKLKAYKQLNIVKVLFPGMKSYEDSAPYDD